MIVMTEEWMQLFTRVCKTVYQCLCRFKLASSLTYAHPTQNDALQGLKHPRATYEKNMLDSVTFSLNSSL